MPEPTAAEFLTELFEFEWCGECGGGAPNHTPMVLDLGAYGANFFAYCLSAPIGDDPDMVAVNAELEAQGRG